MTGIRVFIQTKGVGKKLVVDSIVMQLSLGMALLKLGGIIVDFLMLYIFPSKLIQHASISESFNPNSSCRKSSVCKGEVLEDRGLQ